MAEFVAGKGTTALGIIGTVLGSLGVAGNNGMGLNLLGGGQTCHGGNVNRYELELAQTIAKLDSGIALRDASIYTDQKIVDAYRDLSTRVNSLEGKMYEQDKALAVSNAKIEGTFAVLGEKLNAQRNEFMCALNRERDERCCGDNTIVNYANATFYAKQVADVTTGTSVTAQATYNPLFNCGRCCQA